MKLPCAVTRDLLPLYAENMVEPETKDLVEQHLAECPDCRKRLSESETPAEPPVETAGPLRTLRKELLRRRLYAAVIAALCVFIGVYAYFFRVTDMRFIPWQDGLIEVAGVETVGPAEEDGVPPEDRGNAPSPTAPPLSGGYAGEALVLNVSSFINGFQEHVIVEDDGTTTVFMQAVCTGPIPDHPSHAYTEHTYFPVPDRLIYGFEQPQKLLWGAPMNGGAAVLPRLALAYYLLIAAAAAGAFGLLWAIFRKRERSWIPRQLFFAPVSYILSHLLLKGARTSSFFMERDLFGILLTALALYALLSAAWQVFLARRREA